MKKVIIGSFAVLMFSFSALANTSTVNPSSGTSSMNSSPSSMSKETTTTKSKTTTPTGEVDHVHQESTVKSPASSQIEAQEDMSNMDSTMDKKSDVMTDDVDAE